MAKQRIVNTKFWDDEYITDLSPTEKLLFLYLLTNPLTDLCGAYEITLKRITFDTGLRREVVLKSFERFENAGKIIYRDGWVLIRNFTKHQATNPKVSKGIERSLNGCPDWVKHTLSIGFDSLSPEVTPKPQLLPQPQPEPNGERETPVREIFVGTVTAELMKRMDLKTLPAKLEWQKHAEWAFDNGFTADQMLECYDLLTRQQWRDGPVKPKHVPEHLPNLEKLRKEIAKQDSAKQGSGSDQRRGHGNDPPKLADKMREDREARTNFIAPPEDKKAA